VQVYKQRLTRRVVRSPNTQKEDGDWGRVKKKTASGLGRGKKSEKLSSKEGGGRRIKKGKKIRRSEEREAYIAPGKFWNRVDAKRY